MYFKYVFVTKAEQKISWGGFSSAERYDSTNPQKCKRLFEIGTISENWEI